LAGRPQVGVIGIVFAFDRSKAPAGQPTSFGPQSQMDLREEPCVIFESGLNESCRFLQNNHALSRKSVGRQDVCSQPGKDLDIGRSEWACNDVSSVTRAQ